MVMLVAMVRMRMAAHHDARTARRRCVLYANPHIPYAVIAVRSALGDNSFVHSLYRSYRSVPPAVLPYAMKPLAALVDRIDAVLPQTQCQRCGYAACRPYAEAIALGRTTINQCPPGGEAAIRELAAIVHADVIPLDARFGAIAPRAVARIDEARCIGCTLCIQACPVDAIVGAAKLMHTVLAQECTGCELCVAPCPVDCIAMLPLAYTAQDKNEAAHWRQRFNFRRLRLARERREKATRLATRTETARHPDDAADPAISAAVAAALERARARRRKNAAPAALPADAAKIKPSPR